MKLLQQLISDGEMPSTMRVLALAVVVPVMLVWSVLCIKQNTFIVPDWKIVAMVISAFGSKSLQSLFEAIPGRAADTTPTNEPPV
jgi:hypothetical protein